MSSAQLQAVIKAEAVIKGETANNVQRNSGIHNFFSSTFHLGGYII